MPTKLEAIAERHLPRWCYSLSSYLCPLLPNGCAEWLFCISSDLTLSTSLTAIYCLITVQYAQWEFSGFKRISNRGRPPSKAHSLSSSFWTARRSKRMGTDGWWSSKPLWPDGLLRTKVRISMSWRVGEICALSRVYIHIGIYTDWPID